MKSFHFVVFLLQSLLCGKELQTLEWEEGQNLELMGVINVLKPLLLHYNSIATQGVLRHKDDALRSNWPDCGYV